MAKLIATTKIKVNGKVIPVWSKVDPSDIKDLNGKKDEKAIASLIASGALREESEAKKMKNRIERDKIVRETMAESADKDKELKAVKPNG